MRELRLLLHLQSINAFRLNELRHTQDAKQRRRLRLQLLLYVLLSLMGLTFVGAMMWGLYAGGLSQLLPATCVLIGTASTLMVTMIRAQALFFSHQSIDQLASWPLTEHTIPLAKLINLYGSSLSLCLPVAICSGVFYALGQGFAWFHPLSWLTIALLSPLPAMAAGILLSALPAVALQRMKNRSLLAALISVPLITWFILKIYTMPMEQMDGMALLGTLSGGIESGLAGFYPPAALASGFFTPNAGSMLQFAAYTLLPMGLVGWALLRLYLPLQGLLGRVSLRRAARRTIRPKSPLLALLVKEARRIGASPLYLTNTGVGLWMLPISLLLLPLVQPGIIQLLRSLPMVQDLITRYLPLLVCTLSALSLPATTSISMEGKNAWMMCTAPVSGRLLMGSKALFSLLFCLPPIGLTTILLTIHLKLQPVQVLLCFLLPLALCAFCSVVGLMLDYRFARFDWDNEQQIIKSSAQVGLGMLCFFLTMGLMFVALHFAPLPYVTAIGFGLIALLLAAAALLMVGLAKKQIYQIQ